MDLKLCRDRGHYIEAVSEWSWRCSLGNLCTNTVSYVLALASYLRAVLKRMQNILADDDPNT